MTAPVRSSLLTCLVQDSPVQVRPAIGHLGPPGRRERPYGCFLKGILCGRRANENGREPDQLVPVLLVQLDVGLVHAPSMPLRTLDRQTEARANPTTATASKATEIPSGEAQ